MFEPAAGQQRTLFDRAIAYEQIGQLEAARALLAGKTKLLDADQRRHFAKLDTLLKALDASREWERAGKTARAITVLDSLRFNPLADIHLDRRRVARVDSLHAALREEAVIAARRLWAEADTLIDQKSYDAAILRLAELQKAGRSHSLPFLDSVAGSLRVAEEGKRGWRQKAFFAQAASEAESIWKAVLTAIRWALLAGLFYGAFYLLRLLVRFLWPAKQGTALAVVDLTAGDTDRERQSRLLARDIYREIRALEARNDFIGMDRSRDIDGFALLGADFSFSERVESVIDPDPVKVGIVSLRPREMVAFIGSLFQTPHEFILNGHLSSNAGGAFTLYVEDLPQQARPSAKTRAVARKNGVGERPGNRFWKASRAGDGARDRVVREFALHYLYDLCEHKPTSDWDSFLSYQDGMEHLAAVDDSTGKEARDAALEKACRAFDLAVRRDPGNWMAKFKLAETMRQCGLPEQALRHFTALKSLLGNAAKLPRSLTHYLQQNPEFPLILEYNRGVTLTMRFTVEAQDEALKIFQDLLACLERSEAPAEGEQTQEARTRLATLVRSARAVALVSKQEMIIERQGELSCQCEEFEAMSREIGEIRQMLASATVPEEPEHHAAHELAVAVAHNAVGRSLHLRGNYSEALKELRKAQVQAPEMVDPYIGMAAAFLKLREKADLRWREQMRRLLDRALELAPASGKAHYYYGRLEAACGDTAAAKQHFAAADAHPWTLLQHAELIAEEGDYKTAIEMMRRSLKLMERPDYRYDFMIRCVLNLHRQGQATPALLREAESLAKDLESTAVKNRDKTRAARLLASTREALKALDPGLGAEDAEEEEEAAAAA